MVRIETAGREAAGLAYSHSIVAGGFDETS